MISNAPKPPDVVEDLQEALPEARSRLIELKTTQRFWRLRRNLLVLLLTLAVEGCAMLFMAFYQHNLGQILSSIASAFTAFILLAFASIVGIQHFVEISTLLFAIQKCIDRLETAIGDAEAQTELNTTDL